MLEKLTQHARQLGFADLEGRLALIAGSMRGGKAELIVPLVGEFSAGKTTLVNALTDSKALECATKPTTATIYSIRFGSETCKAIVYHEDGTTTEVRDLSSLKNDELADTALVEVYDTSTRVPESIVIVDTPGLSSQEAKHRQTLVDFLPQADAIILVSDINQQITRSLSDFAKTIALSKRPIYLAFSQCDTKSREEVEQAKQYLKANTELPLSGVVSLSAKSGEMSELYNLLSDLQRDKTAILERVNEYRTREIAREMVKRIDTLLNSSESDNSLDDAIREQQIHLNKIKRQISKLEDEISAGLGDLQREASRKFEDKIFERLETIVAGKSSGSYDAEATGAINSVSSLILSDYRTRVLDLFAQKVREHASGEGEVSFEGLASLDLSQLSVQGLSYDISLDTAGHEWDSMIASGLKVAAVAGAVVTAGAALAGSGAVAGAMSAQGAISALDTASDVGSMISNRSLRKAIEKGSAINTHLGTLNQFDQRAGQNLGQSKGLVESVVGFVTEETMGKPQRRRAIHNYIDSSLLPSFKDEMRRISMEVGQMVGNFLSSSAEAKTSELTSRLEELRRARGEEQSAFEAQIKELKQIKQNILSL